MPCYQCNGEGGDDSKLCPACTIARLERYKRRNDPEYAAQCGEVIRNNSAWDRADKFFKLRSVQICLGSVVLVLFSYWLLFWSVGPMFGVSDHKRLYVRCMSIPSMKDAYAIFRNPEMTEILQNQSRDVLQNVFRKNSKEAVCEHVAGLCQRDSRYCAMSRCLSRAISVL